MDYPFQLSGQLQQLLKSLRKSRNMTQAELAQRLGVVQSRIADIERNPGTVSVEQLLQVLAILGAQMVVRDTSANTTAGRPGVNLEGHGQTTLPSTAALTIAPKPAPSASDTEADKPDDEPRGQW